MGSYKAQQSTKKAKWEPEEPVRMDTSFCDFFNFFPIEKWRGQEFHKQLYVSCIVSSLVVDMLPP